MKHWLKYLPLMVLAVLAVGQFMAGPAQAETMPALCTFCHLWNTDADVYAPNHDSVYDASQAVLSPDCRQSGCHSIISPITGNPNLWVQHLGKLTTSFPGGMVCKSCHHGYEGTKLDPNNIQTQIRENNTQCTGCHGANIGGKHEGFHNTVYVDNPPVDCSSCHPMVSQNTGQPNLWVWHLGRQTTTYNTGTGYAQGMVCQSCHSYSGTKLNPADISNAIATGNTKCTACHGGTLHDIDPNLKHRTQFLGDPSFCAQSGCHAPSRTPKDPGYPTSHNLQDYHVEKRTTSFPDGMTCNGCHDYSGAKLDKSRIGTAIRDGNTACDACHNLQSGGHEPIHDTQYDSAQWPDLTVPDDCRKCHPMLSANTGKPNLWVWHLGRQTATYNAANGYPGGMTCQSCHNYSGTKLSKTTIDGVIQRPNAVENKDCGNCHGTIHPDVISSHNTSWMTDKPVDCSTCHDGYSEITGTWNLWMNHLGKKTTSYPVTGITCTSCHAYTGSKLSQTDINSAVFGNDTRCTTCHRVTIHPMDPNPDHRTDFVGDPVFCTQSGCHAPSRPAKDTERNLQDFHVEKQTTSYPGGMNCDGCHNYTGSKLDKSAVNAAIAKGGQSGSPNTQCSACHGSGLSQGHEVKHNTVYINNPPVDCGICHSMVSSNTGQPNLWVWHISRQTTTYNSGAGYANGMQCQGCHNYSGTKLNASNIAAAIAAGNTKCDACHSLHELDPNTKHRTAFMGDPASCTISGCHAPSRTPKDTERNLQDFHLEKQTTSYPGGMTCESCHKYTGGKLSKSNVDEAISAGITACNACHTEISTNGHEAQHTTSFDSSESAALGLCPTCHITNSAEPAPYTLWDVHIGKKSTSYSSINCGTCHNYAGTKLQKADIDNAIATGNKDCKACHTGVGNHAFDQNSALPSSVHVGKACTSCHSRATASAVKPARPDSSLTVVPGTNVCFTCHNSTGGAPNVQASFAKTYRHKSPKCASCHNPHVENKSATSAPDADGSLKGTPGVAVTNGAAGSSPSFTAVSSVGKQYELCFKCHSVNSMNPGGGLPAGTTDKAVQLNTNNQSYHPVEGTGKNLGIREAAFVLGSKWNPTSGTDGDYSAASAKVYCTDCHGSDNVSEPKGAHGSSNQWMLKRKLVGGYWKDAGVTASAGLAECLMCHEYNVYYGGATGSRFPRHQYHVQDKEISCIVCHDSHGRSDKPHLIRVQSSGSGSKSNPTIQSFTHTSSGGSCSPSCHGSKSYSHNYPHVYATTTATVDQGIWISKLSGYANADNSGVGSDITGNLKDGNLSTAYDVSRLTSGDNRVVAVKVNKEALGLTKVSLRFYVTNITGSPDGARIYAYQSDANSLNTSYMSYSVSSTGWKEVDVTTLASRMNGFGWMKFRLVSADQQFKVSEIETKLSQ